MPDDPVRHFLEITEGAVVCTCGHRTAGGRKLAAQHQFAVFLLDAAHGTPAVTNCLFCGTELPMRAEDTDPMVAYGIWLTQPCSNCGKPPRDAVAPAVVNGNK